MVIDLQILDARVTDIANVFYLSPRLKNKLRMMIVDVALECVNTSKHDSDFHDEMKGLYNDYKKK